MSTMVERNCEALGRYGYLLADVVRDLFKNGIDLQELSNQTIRIGTLSLPIVILTGLFTGMVLALQTAYGLTQFGAKNYVGNIVGISLTRELGPVLTALMVCGRVGAGIAAEIGSMAVTEQIDAIRALGASPIRKLVTPRVVAAFFVLPCLTIFADLVGVYGGAIIAIYELDLSAHLYFNSMMKIVVMSDVIDGLVKSAVFGILIVSIACSHGMRATGGTAGVGRVTTAAVVTGSIAILISDFFMTKFLIMLAGG